MIFCLNWIVTHEEWMLVCACKLNWLFVNISLIQTIFILIEGLRSLLQTFKVNVGFNHSHEDRFWPAVYINKGTKTITKLHVKHQDVHNSIKKNLFNHHWCLFTHCVCKMYHIDISQLIRITCQPTCETCQTIFKLNFADNEISKI